MFFLPTQPFFLVRVMNYKEFIETVYQRHSGNVKYGLERMIKLLSEMGSPEKKLKGFHVAGTNGKGSTCAMLENIMLHQNLTVGLNTSPHLLDYRERIRINGENIKSEELIKVYEKYSEIFEKNEASFFEITTAMAFYYFYHQKIDTSIFEVGLGGRLDGTNPFRSTVTAITSISTDHPKSLGDTIEKIAYEKAGIIKKKTPVILGKIPDEALAVIKKTAESKIAPIYLFDRDFFIDNIEVSPVGTIFDYSFPAKNIHITKLELNLLGAYQAINASVAITSMLLYQELTGTEINLTNIEKSIRDGLSSVNWPGRLQIICRKPLTIIDGAHNEEGVENLLSNIKKIYPDFEVNFVLAILRDKNITKMINDICSLAKKVYISKNQSNRAAEIEEQVEIARLTNTPYCTFDSVIEAVSSALSEAGENEIIVVTGSLYTISEILAARDVLFTQFNSM